MRWPDTPLLIGVNLAAGAIWLAAIVDIVRTPKADWDAGYKTLAVVLVAGLVTAWVVYVPLAPAVWFLDWRSKERWGHHPGRAVAPAAERPPA
jgi:hypothetical protein